MPLDISQSCFVFASAGSGKTKLLVDRYIKLLLCGIHPSEILCLTFTNMAVEEMQVRINTILKQFYLQSPEETKIYLISHLKIRTPDSKMLDHARNLFLTFQNELSQLKITTIHGVCQLLLQQYPIESTVSLNFQILNADENQHLIHQAIRQYFTSNKTNIIDYFSATACYDLIQELFTNEERYYSILHMALDLSEYRQFLMQKFHVQEEIPFDSFQQEAIATYFPNTNIEDICLTKTNQIRRNLKHEKIDLQAIADVVYKNKSNFLKREIIDKTISILKIIREINTELNKLKIQKLTFTDILYKARYLLTNSDAKDYVLSNIMKGIKSILIDEAQDLSLIQWEILCLLIEQCYLDNINNKTVFIVGDIKQSIYLFQNARYELLLQVHNYSNLILKKINKSLTTVYLDKNYRTYPNILRNIDLILCDFSNSAFGNTYRKHISVFPDRYNTNNSRFEKYVNNNTSNNCTDITNLSIKRKKSEDINNAIILDTTVKTQTGNKYSPAKLEDIFKLIEISNYQDIANYIYQRQINSALILIRSKNEFNINLYYELIKLGMAVAPLDKILLREAPIIQTVIALSNLQNEYNLVSVLQSKYVFACPLLPKDIFSLCYKRTRPILENLKEKFPEYYGKVHKITMKKTFLVNFFYYLTEEIIIPQQFADRKIINMFLDLVIQYYENNEPDDIDSFLEYFQTSNVSISNNSNLDNMLRFSSIHSAKGLEADTVILLDFKLSADKNKMKFVYEEGANLFNANNMPLFFVKPPNDNSFYEAQNIIERKYQEEENELMRLLYVALTRPRKRIYIFGKSNNENTVFNLISKKLSLN